MSLYRDTSRNFDKRLRLVASVVDLDPGIDVLRSQLKEFRRTAGRPVLDRLADAVVDGNTSEMDVLFACALAEAASTPAAHNDVISGIRDRIHRRIRDRYAMTAVPTYEAVAAQFNSAADKLTDAFRAVDIEAPAEQILNRPDKERKMWTDAAVQADELTRLMGALHAAAGLAGCEDTDEALIALCVDPTQAHRREVWTAWETEESEAKAARTAANHLPFSDTMTMPTPSRCGRWSALLRAGAIIRACPADEFSEYRKPKPMVERTINGAGGPQRILLDPEDPDYQPLQPPTFVAPPRAGRITVSR
jgi:hypothetical protein